MSSRRLTCVALTLLGCQGSPRKDSAPVEPTVVEIRDGAGAGSGHGAILAQLRPGHPCRGTIGPVELIVGSDPLVAQLGDTKWTGDVGSNGATLVRDGAAQVRLFPVDDPAGASVLDTEGIPLVRISTVNGAVYVADPSGRRVRSLTRQGGRIAIDQPPLTVTGTDDLVLAALLSAPELSPEVRVLTACERTFVHVSKGT